MRFRERKNHFEIWEPVVNAERTKVRCLIRWHPQGMKVPDNVSALLNENELKALYTWMTHRFKVPEGFGGKEQMGELGLKSEEEDDGNEQLSQ